MSGVTVFLYRDDALMIVPIGTERGRFLSLRWSGGSLLLPDYDADCAKVARTLAADLLAAADAIDPPVALPEAV